MGKRGSKSRGRGGRGGKSHIQIESEFGDDFVALGEFIESGRRGRGRGRGAFLGISSVFVPSSTHSPSRANYQGARPLTPRGRGSTTPRGRGGFQPQERFSHTPIGRGRGDTVSRGRGRGFGHQTGDYDSGNEQRNRLLEPMTFVRAELTARTLFQEEEDILKPEVADAAQGDNVPTASVIEAAFASYEDAGDNESHSDPDDFQGTPTIPAEPTKSWTSPMASSSSERRPKLDIASAVSLATSFKDAALTPREEHFTPVSPAMSKAIIDERLSTCSSKSDSNLGSDSEPEDVVLFLPQPSTPLRSMTPLPLLAVPGPARGVTPSPIRPSPLATSFIPSARENESLQIVSEAIRSEPETTTQHNNNLSLNATEPCHKIDVTATEEPIPTINFEDLSSAMFIDTTPTPIVPPSTAKVSESPTHILGTHSPKTPSPPGSGPHDLAFKFTSKSSAQQTEQTLRSDHIKTLPDTKPTETNTNLMIEPAPDFHAMTFSFAPRTAASRVRRPPPGEGRHGLGFRFKSTPRVPRVGDSDLDWGDDGPPKVNENQGQDEEDEESESESESDHGMVEDIDSNTMFKFLKRIEAPEWVTMDDIQDEEMLRREDEEEGSMSGDSEETEDSDEETDDEDFNQIIAAAEAELVDSDGSDDGFDESFSTRLARMRQNTGRNSKSKGKGKGKGKGRIEDSSDDEVQMSGFSWTEKDEDFIDRIQEQLDEEILLKRERKRGLISPPTSPAQKGKNKHVPPEMQALWERDRAKKAENKRLRALQRQAAAQQAPKRGSGSKASFIFNNSNGPTSLLAIEPKLRAFVANLAMKTMALQAMDKEARRQVHILAECFGIKTASKGSGTGRYVTLIRTSRTGLAIDEAKIRRLLRAAEDAEDGGIAAFNRAYYHQNDDREGTSGGKTRIRTRDGEVVGRAAAKIGTDNIGHQLLSRLGWNEGDVIGKSGGLSDPLVAVMKSTKLGLGAIRK